MLENQSFSELKYTHKVMSKILHLAKAYAPGDYETSFGEISLHL